MKQFQEYLEYGKSRSELFEFWDEYTNMVYILLEFLQAERNADWEAHLTASAAMIPYDHAFDHLQYFRWGLVYLIDMHCTPSQHMQWMSKMHSPLTNSIVSQDQILSPFLTESQPIMHWSSHRSRTLNLDSNFHLIQYLYSSSKHFWRPSCVVDSITRSSAYINALTGIWFNDRGSELALSSLEKRSLT